MEKTKSGSRVGDSSFHIFSDHQSHVEKPAIIMTGSTDVLEYIGAVF